MQVSAANGQGLAQRVARHIVQMIVSGESRVGSRLPSERDLAEQLQVSRPVVREAFRILEGLGVVDVRRGSGVFVVENDASGAWRTDRFWTQSGATLDVLGIADVLAMRAGELASIHITEDELGALRKLLHRQTTATTNFDLEELATIDREFHLRIVQATRNPLLESFETYARQTFDRDQVLVLGSSPQTSLDEHAQIVTGLGMRSPDIAGAALRYHTLRCHTVIREIVRRRVDVEGETTH